MKTILISAAIIISANSFAWANDNPSVSNNVVNKNQIDSHHPEVNKEQRLLLTGIQPTGNNLISQKNNPQKIQSKLNEKKQKNEILFTY